MGKELHKGHRERVKDRYIYSGLDSFEDHQVLELILFYCYPMVDTNEKAHKMINEFGTLTNLLDANPLDIEKRCKVSTNVAVLLSLIPPLSRRYLKSKWGKKMVLDSSAKVGNYAISLFMEKKNEAFYLICLDSQRKLNFAPLISEGTIDQAPIYTREIVEQALKYQAASVIITHNHPSGLLVASRADIEATKKIIMALETINIEVLDHIIVAGEEYMSFAEKKMLRLFY